MSKENKTTKSQRIRQATLGDVDKLISICQSSFPDALRWQGPRFLVRIWWNKELISTFSETWVCLSDSKVVGFFILVTDVAEYSKESRKRNHSIFAKLFTFVACPRISIAKLLWKICWHKNTSGCAISRVDSDVSMDKITWIESLAVLPEMRGQGLAMKMLEFCKKRTLELRRQVVKLRVDVNNIAALNLYEKTGFASMCRPSTNSISYAYVLSAGSNQ